MKKALILLYIFCVGCSDTPPIGKSEYEGLQVRVGEFIFAQRGCIDCHLVQDEVGVMLEGPSFYSLSKGMASRQEQFSRQSIGSEDREARLFDLLLGEDTKHLKTITPTEFCMYSATLAIRENQLAMMSYIKYLKTEDEPAAARIPLNRSAEFSCDVKLNESSYRARREFEGYEHALTIVYAPVRTKGKSESWSNAKDRLGISANSGLDSYTIGGEKVEFKNGRFFFVDGDRTYIQSTNWSNLIKNNNKKQ